MTPEAQRIAIAEACGFRAEEWESGGWMLYRGDTMVHHALDGTGSRESAFAIHAPDYLGDLNVMHEAERFLGDKWMPYARLLLEITTGCGPEMPLGFLNGATLSVAVHATAAQRAEAFLRTIGKWDDKA